MKVPTGDASPARHAYLITAYDNFPLLRVLLELLDDERNDIFLHIDRKSSNVDVNRFRWGGQRSRITLVPRTRVHWGEYSQVKSVMQLLREAVPGRYAYYHLLSGSDLPIKDQDHIHEFVGDHAGLEFIDVSESYDEDWVELHHWFNRTLKSPNALDRAIRRVVVRPLLRAEKAWRRARPRSRSVTVRKGSDWWSISHAMAEHVLAHEPAIKRLFGHALVPTEFYVQTLAWNSDFRTSIYNPDGSWSGNLRLIDWARGNPYTFRSADLQDLLSSNRLFARKFDWEVDREVVEQLHDHLKRSGAAPPDGGN